MVVNDIWVTVTCTVLYCTVLYCTVLYCTVLYCTVLYCVRPRDCQCTVGRAGTSDLFVDSEMAVNRQ